MSEEKKFNAADHLITLKGKQYLEVKWRLVWFKEEYLDKGWSIHTELVKGDNDSALFKASALDDKGVVRATGYGFVNKDMFARPVEKAETAAIGRCLAILGLGTQFAQELDEDTEGGELADAPVAKPVARTVSAAGYAAKRAEANPVRAVAAKFVAPAEPAKDEYDVTSIPF